MVEFRHLSFCGKCGGALSKENDTVYRCESCGARTYNNPVGAVGVILFSVEGKVLLSVRAIEPDKGQLDIIGGFMNFAEQPQATIEREFGEETGGVLPEITLFKVFTSSYTPNISPLNVVYVASFSEAEAQLLSPRDDVSELIWLGMDELDGKRFSGATSAKLLEEAFAFWQENQ